MNSLEEEGSATYNFVCNDFRLHSSILGCVVWIADVSLALQTQKHNRGNWSLFISFMMKALGLSDSSSIKSKKRAIPALHVIGKWWWMLPDDGLIEAFGEFLCFSLLVTLVKIQFLLLLMSVLVYRLFRVGCPRFPGHLFIEVPFDASVLPFYEKNLCSCLVFDDKSRMIKRERKDVRNVVYIFPGVKEKERRKDIKRNSGCRSLSLILLQSCLLLSSSFPDPDRCRFRRIPLRHKKKRILKVKVYGNQSLSRVLTLLESQVGMQPKEDAEFISNFVDLHQAIDFLVSLLTPSIDRSGRRVSF